MPGRQRNLAAVTVLRSVLDNGPVARSTIARITGLSAAAVTRQYAELAGLGLVREVDTWIPRVSVGRPHVPVDIDVDRHVVCGIHIALGHTTVALVDLRGRVLAQEREPHGDTSPTAVLSRAADRVPDFLARHAGNRRPLGIGVATGGWVDPVDGVIVRHSQLGWRDVAARDVLRRRLGMPVHVESHSRALARAEQLFGDARSRTSLVHLFIGNVVDAAIATAGTVHHGPGSAAGDIAHLSVDGSSVCPCGRFGCLQAEVSDRSVALRAVADGVIARPVLADLLEAARAGERRAVELFRMRARQVGQVAALLLDVINPEVLVVTELGSMHLPECLADLHEVIGSHSRVCTEPQRTVVTTSFGDSVLSVAAGSVVLQEIYGRPLELSRSA